MTKLLFQKTAIASVPKTRVSEYLEESPFRLARPRSQSLAMFCERSVPGEGGWGEAGARHEQKLASLCCIIVAAGHPAIPSIPNRGVD
jgi:hypothetical protein